MLPGKRFGGTATFYFYDAYSIQIFTDGESSSDALTAGDSRCLADGV